MTRRKRPNLSLKKDTIDVDKQEELLNQLQKADEPVIESNVAKKERKKRFTMDLPVSLHTRISTKASSKGQTIKGYLLTLIWKDLGD